MEIRDLAVDLDQARLAWPPSGDGFLADLLDGVLQGFCLGETLAVPLFSAMRQGTLHPVVRPALDRILRDEAVHRAFGWDALDALLELDPDGVRHRARWRLPGMIAGFRHEYAEAPDAEPLSTDERSMSLLEPAEYQLVFWRCMEEDIRPRFESRGIRLAP